MVSRHGHVGHRTVYAEVIEHRGQWVKIVGLKAPKETHQFQVGPQTLAMRIVADYAITKGDCLLVCANDKDGVPALQRGFLEMTELQITALYGRKYLCGHNN